MCSLVGNRHFLASTTIASSNKGASLVPNAPGQSFAVQRNVFLAKGSGGAGSCQVPHGRMYHNTAVSCVPANKVEVAIGRGSSTTTRTGKDIIVQYYDAYNNGDLVTIGALLAEDVSYHDMIYQDPFEGREATLIYLQKVMNVIPKGLKFVIDDVTDGDPFKVGIVWHLEFGQGYIFPFSRGCSFYTLNSQGQIQTARDLVEPAMKPGSSTLKVLALVAPLVERLGPNADPSRLKDLPVQSALVWAFYIGYISYVMFSTGAPGAPAYATPPEVLQEVLDMSINFFYINIGLDAIHLAPLPSPTSPPVYEGVFNIINAWGMMFLPLILVDRKSQKIDKKIPWWIAIMFVTNVFFIPFLALRAAPDPPAVDKSSATEVPSLLPSWSPIIGATALGVGLLSIGWALGARPEFGGLAERWDYFKDQMATNRVFYAFILDAGLYTIWQAWMMEGVPGRFRFVPFFGLVAWLIGGEQQGKGEGA